MTMLKHLRSSTLLISVVMAASSCSRPATEPEETPRPEEPIPPEPPVEPAEPQQPADTGPAKTTAEAAADNNALGIDLYKSVAQSGDNVFLSPHSIAVALAMTYEGAHGDTAVQMSESLHFEVPPARLRPAFQALNQALKPAEDAGYALHVANALWGMQGHKFRPEFLDVLRTSYEAPLQQENFTEAEAARDTINDW
jgi:serpin B